MSHFGYFFCIISTAYSSTESTKYFSKYRSWAILFPATILWLVGLSKVVPQSFQFNRIDFGLFLPAEDILSQIIGTANIVQVCERCLTKQSAKNHIVTHETMQCNSKCETCLQMKAVCQECQRKGHISYLPALRCCESCLKESVSA